MQTTIMCCLIVLGSQSCCQDGFNDFADTVFVGTHQTVSSSKGFDAFNTNLARSMMRIDNVEDGKFSGMISQVGESWNGEPEHLVKENTSVFPFTATFKNDKTHIVYSYSSEYSDGRRYRRTVRLFGTLNEGTIKGYFLTDWAFADGETIQFGGPFELSSQ